MILSNETVQNEIMLSVLLTLGKLKENVSQWISSQFKYSCAVNRHIHSIIASYTIRPPGKFANKKHISLYNDYSKLIMAFC